MTLNKEEQKELSDAIDRAHIDLSQASLYAKDSKYPQCKENLIAVVRSIGKIAELSLE